MSEHERDQHKQYWELAGWLLFVVCAILFLVDSLLARNPLTIAASAVFLVACFAFIVPLVQNTRDS